MAKVLRNLIATTKYSSVKMVLAMPTQKLQMPLDTELTTIMTLRNKRRVRGNYGKVNLMIYWV